MSEIKNYDKNVLIWVDGYKDIKYYERVLKYERMFDVEKYE